MNPYLMEFLGTMLMISIACIISCFVGFSKMIHVRNQKMLLTIWVLAGSISLLIPCWLFSNNTTYYNSALTLVYAFDGTLPFDVAVYYLVAQAAGAFAGAFVAYLFFLRSFNTFEDPGTKLFALCNSFGFSSFKAKRALDFMREVVATFLLIFAIKLIGAADFSIACQIILVTIVNLVLGFLLGAHYYCAMNPIRDMMPRVAHAILPFRCKGSSVWNQGRRVWIASTIGAAAAEWLYAVIF